MRPLFLAVLLAAAAVRSCSQSGYFINPHDSTPLYVQDIGKGEPVIILAGGPGLNAVYMKKVYDSLSTKYRCIVLDQRGTGKSIVATVNATTADMDHYMGDLEKLRKYLKLQQMVLVGHSWGGYVVDGVRFEIP